MVASDFERPAYACARSAGSVSCASAPERASEADSAPAAPGSACAAVADASSAHCDPAESSSSSSKRASATTNPGYNTAQEQGSEKSTFSDLCLLGCKLSSILQPIW